MKGTIDRYLDRVMAVADFRDEAREAQVREELRDHLEQKVEALQTDGYDPAEALVKAVEDHGKPVVVGYQLRPWRLIDVRLHGTARGIIAIGPKARGIIAIGGIAMGVIALGGVAIGAVSFGGVALGLLLAWGGLAGGALAYGGLALGLIAFGGLAIGGIALGGGALGVWVPGAGQVFGSHYTWQTIPQALRGIGELLSFSNREEFRSWSRSNNILTAVTLTLLGLTSFVQIVMTSKEIKRIRRIDPSILQ